MTYKAIAAKLDMAIRKPTGFRGVRIAGLLVQTVFYPASKSIGIYVADVKAADKAEAAALIYRMHRQSGIA